MAMPPKYQWRRTRQKDTVRQVGCFFEQLAQALFDGVVGDSGEGDLVVWNVPLGIEIKASDNNHTFRIPVDQMQVYVEMATGFPFEHFLYGLFCYRNRSNGQKRKSLLRPCPTEAAVHEVLARNVDTLYVFDIAVIQALRFHNGTATRRLPCEPDRPVIELSRQDLRQFTEKNQCHIFTKLDLSPKRWGITERSMSVQLAIGLLSYDITVPVVLVTHQRFRKQCEHMLWK